MVGGFCFPLYIKKPHLSGLTGRQTFCHSRGVPQRHAAPDVCSAVTSDCPGRSVKMVTFRRSSMWRVSRPKLCCDKCLSVFSWQKSSSKNASGILRSLFHIQKETTSCDAGDWFLLGIDPNASVLQWPHCNVFNVCLRRLCMSLQKPPSVSTPQGCSTE